MLEKPFDFEVVRHRIKNFINLYKSSNSLNEKENNFIGSIVDFKYCYVLTYTDITTGELYCEILDHNNSKVINY